MARKTFASSMRQAAQNSYEKHGVCNNYVPGTNLSNVDLLKKGK
jgi:hypothetical protein